MKIEHNQLESTDINTVDLTIRAKNLKVEADSLLLNNAPVSGGGDPYASQAEAEAGTAEDRAMNPLRTAQAIAALAPVGGGGDPYASQAEAEAGTAEDRAMNPLRTAQAIAALAPVGGGGDEIEEITVAL